MLISDRKGFVVFVYLFQVKRKKITRFLNLKQYKTQTYKFTRIARFLVLKEYKAQTCTFFSLYTVSINNTLPLYLRLQKFIYWGITCRTAPLKSIIFIIFKFIFCFYVEFQFLFLVLNRHRV